MINDMARPALAWLLTYAVHSTVLLGLAWMITRRGRLSVTTRDLVWKVALMGGVVTAFAQTQLDVRPTGSISLVRATAPSTSAANDARSSHDPASDAVRRADERAARDDVTESAPTRSPSFLAGVAAESVVVIAWGALALMFAAVYLGRRLILVGRLANRRAITSGPLPAMLDALRLEVGYRPGIRLTSVNTISSPVALGLREICLPEAVLTELGADEQRGLLAHELAHLVRRDPLWLYAASLIERVFFFQPLNGIARLNLQRDAEYLCDDWAAARTGSGLPLAHCLARVAEWIEASPLGVPVAGMAEQRSLLVTRVARLIDGKHSGSHMSKLAFSLAAGALLATVVAAAPGVRTRALALPIPLAHAPQASTGKQADEPAEQQGDPAVIAALIERLKDTDAGVRRAAASSLGRLKGRAAVAPLIQALGDKSREVRGAAAEALGNIEDPAAIPGLSRLLGDESADVREHALDALSNFSDALSVAQVLPALRDTRPSLRAKAAEVLGQIGDRAAVEPLLKLLDDQSADVRHETIHALEHLQDRSVTASILPLLHDGNANVRGAALQALRELGGAIPESAVLAALKDANADVRREALEYVKQKPTSTLIPELRGMLDDSDSDVRQATVEALAEIRDPVARATLRDALKSTDPKVRRRAAEALGERP